MRSSCDAWARKRRKASSDALRRANACSICASMALRARPSRPTSVRGSAGSTRRVRSPAAMAPAVTAMSSSGRISRRTIHQAKRAETEQHADGHQDLDQQRAARVSG